LRFEADLELRCLATRENLVNSQSFASLPAFLADFAGPEDFVGLADFEDLVGFGGFEDFASFASLETPEYLGDQEESEGFEDFVGFAALEDLEGFGVPASLEILGCAADFANSVCLAAELEGSEDLGDLARAYSEIL